MSRAARVRLWIFLLIGAVALVNAGARYAGLGERFFGHDYQVRVELARSGGLFERAEVTWRGFTVGRVRSMDFRTDGVTAVLSIDDRWHIPADLRAEVHNRSAVGEQYLDLIPRTDRGPYLHDGSVIPVAATSTPVQDQEFILALHRLLTSIDTADLATVVDEAGTAFEGAGDDIARLLRNARTVLDAARSVLPQTRRLLRTAAIVLGTQDARMERIKALTGDLNRVSAVFAARDADLRRILREGTGAAAELTALADGLDPAAAQLLDRLVSLTSVLSDRLAGVEETLVALPWALASAETPGRDGRAHFTFVGAPDPPACQLGYLPPSKWRSALDPQHSEVPDTIGCDEPGAVPRGAESVHPRG